ncbi:hypothetical protein JYP51_01985 [Ponticoccus gilvus]|nr:hypothetical protein [Enemella evansiae]
MRHHPAAGAAEKGADAQESLAEQGLDGHPRPNTKEENQTDEALQTEDGTPSDGGDAAKGGAFGGKKNRPSRAKVTTEAMAEFMEGWSYDYLSITTVNGINGSAEKPGMTEAPTDQEGYNALARGPVLRPERKAAEVHEGKALDSLLRFVVASGLYKRAEGEGRQGYKVGFEFGSHPTKGKPFVSVRAGHSRNMPGMEISGGNGACALLAPKVREQIGPHFVSRADVSMDINAPGLFERLHGYMIVQSRGGPKDPLPPEVRGDDEGGKTLYWLYNLGVKANGKTRYRKRGVWLRVYEKDKERLARGMIAPQDVNPHLVRVEFVFLHDEQEGKLKLSLMTPQKMISAHRRSRELVQWLARECAGLTKEEAVLALTKVATPACDKTAEERAITGIAQYKTPIVDGSIERIVNRDFGGDWSEAKIAAADVYEEAGRLLLSELAMHGTIENRIRWHGIDQVRTEAEKAERLRDAMNGFLSRQKAAAEAAAQKMADAYAVATDGDQRRLNDLRSEIVWENAVLLCQRGEKPPTLAALDRSQERALREFLQPDQAA